MSSFKGKADVYRNLRDGCWSVRSRERDDRYGLVVARVSDVLVKDASFVVSEAGRKRVLAEGRKNVHAYVRGVVDVDLTGTREGVPDSFWWNWWNNELWESGVSVTYNPYHSGRFRRTLPLNGAAPAVESADFVLLSEAGVRPPVTGWGVKDVAS